MISHGSDTHIKGSTKPDAPKKGIQRKARVFSTERVCIQDYCEIILSKYNKGPYCYSHTSVKYPRVRGRVKEQENASS